MSNSNLAVYKKISPHSDPRVYPITKITIHHMAGNSTIEGCGDWFAKSSTKASANYGIGTDGRIALYVEEQNRAWTSSDWENDHRAVTIEVANDGGAPDWHVSDKALESLILLCVDICKRNGIEKLNYTGDKSGNLTRHNMFVATTCPGPYLQSKFPFIAEEVNKRLSDAETLYKVTVEGLPKAQAENLAQMYAGTDIKVRVDAIEPVTPAPNEPATPEVTEPAPVVPETPWTPQAGDIVMFNGGTQYRNANAASGSAAAAGQAKISKIAEGKKHPYSLIRTGKTGPYGWVDAGTFTKA